MINFIYGDIGTGKSTYILEQMKLDYQNKKRSFLIVPEQQTVIKERQIASLLPSGAQLFCEVTNFTRLSNRVFRDLGGLKSNYVTKSGKNLLMYRAICACRSRLNTYKIEEGHEKSSIKLFLETISELKSYNVTIDKLENEVEGLEGNDILKFKLTDLCTIWKTYEDLLYRSFSDPFDNMVILAEKIAESDYFKDANVYVDSFYGYSLAQLDVLKSIINSASNVTFAFDCPIEANEKTVQFSMVAKNARGVISLCEGKKTNTVSLKTDHKHKFEDLKLASKYIWDFTKEKIANSDNITLVKCGDEFEECEYVSSEICKLIRENGYKYSEIAIIARATSNYIGILDYALKKYNIPHFLSSPSEWLSKPLLKMIFSALNFIDSRRREDILTFAKSQYIDTDARLVADFEGYITSWDIYGDKFYNDDYWNANPDGFVEAITSEQEKKLERVLKIRDLLLNKLRHFSSSGTVKEHALSLFEFLQENEIVNKLEKERHVVSKADAYVLSQIWEAVLGALDTLVDICGDEFVDISTFSTLLHYAFIDAKVGTIPTGEDNVIIADAHSVRAENIRHVFVLGANEGTFPASVSDDSIFSDAEKLLLRSHGITLSETSERRADDELMFFKASLAIASEGAHICALTTGVDGSARQLSSGYKRIEALFDKIKKVDATRIDTIDKLYTKEIAKEYLGIANGELRAAISNELGIIPPEAPDFSNSDEVLKEETVKSLFGTTLKLSQSQLSLFKTCKYKYYVDRFLKPSASKQYFFNSADSGTLVHNTFEHFIKMLIDKPDEFEKLTDDEIKRIVSSLVDSYTKIVCGGVHKTNRLLRHFERLKNNLYVFVDKLVNEFSHCKFKPVKTELEFSLAKNAAPTLTFDLGNGKTAYMVGKADRIDTYKKYNEKTKDYTMYVRVADYKIGNHVFSEKAMIEECDVQLPLYLFSILKMQDCEIKKELLAGASRFAPAGFFYMPLNIGKLTLDDEISDDTLIMGIKEEELLKKGSAYSGRFLDDDEIIMLQDNAPGANLLPSIGRARKTHYLSEEAFYQLGDAMEKAIIDTSSEIYSGKMETNPKKFATDTACEFCDHRAICRRREK